MDKKDEEELKEWKEKNLNYVENYGIDIYENGKKKKKAEKIIDFTNRVVKIIMIIFALIIIIFTAGLLVYRWKIIHDSLHINPKETIEAMYDQQITEVSKNINSNQNGSYIYEIKSKPEIKFNVIVEWASMNEDYADNCQKYFYDNWKNENKNIIQTDISYYEDVILKYEQYIPIQNENEIENAVKIMYDLVMSAGEYFSPDWNLYLKVDDENRIYPFDYQNLDLNKSINKSKEEYFNILNNKNAQQNSENT